MGPFALRALPRFFQPVPFCEDVAAAGTSGRGYIQYTRPLHLFKVAVDFFFGQSDLPGEDADRKAPAGEKVYQFLSDGRIAFPGDDFFLFHR